MLKKTKLTYRGINRDVTKSKRNPEFYFDAENIRIQATDSATTGSVTNDKGNDFACTLPTGQVIIGHAVMKDYLVVFSTSGSLDKITRITLPTYQMKELFSGALNFSKDHLIETEVYYESDEIQKVYWVDGINQLRHINIISEGYTQQDATLFDAVPEVTFSSPYVSSIDYGGIHTAGMIQYAYNLVKQNGSQSAISPVSELYPLNKSKAGGKVNEYVGKILNVTISNVDLKYDIIRLYAIKYTSYNEAPSISIIAEETIGNNPEFTFSDDGRIIRAIAADQFTFLGGTAFIPSTITSKFNRLILGNIKELYFDVNTEDYDTRAYRFPLSSTVTKIKNKDDSSYTNVTYDGEKIVDLIGNAIIPTDHDCITPTDEFNDSTELVESTLLYDEQSFLADTQDENIFQYLPTDIIPSQAGMMKATIWLDVPGISSKSKTYFIHGTPGINCAQTIVSKLNGLDYKIVGHRITAYIGVLTSPLGENLTPNSILTYIENSTTGVSVAHQLTVTIVDVQTSTNSTLNNVGLYKYNSTIYGATGTNIEVEIVKKALADPRNVLKSNEVYRLGIEFYNKRGQCTEPKWIADIKAPQGNLNNDYNTLKVTLKNPSILTALGVVGWRILRVDRTEQDKTILCQGIVSPMIFQNYENIGTSDITKGITYADNDLLKMPTPFMRNTSNLYETWKRKSTDSLAPYINKLQHGKCISEEATTGEIDDPRQEIFRDSESGDNNSGNNSQLSFEETRLFQLYAPEVIFNNINLSENLKLRFNHTVLNPIASCSEWAKQYNTDNTLLAAELKRSGRLSLYKDSLGRFNALNQYARIGGTGDHNIQNKYQYYRNYSFGNYIADKEYSILETPVKAGTGQNGLKYANLSKYNFANSLGTLLADKNHQDGGDDGIISVNSHGIKNITVVLSNQQTLESIYSESALVDDSNGVFEMVRTIANQYGGNTFEARSRNSYLRIGSYQTLTSGDNTILINQAGDTFVGKFRFARILGNSSSVLSSKYCEITEIVEYPVETSIDINNRADASISWDSVFMPSFDEYHHYNKVYSQQPIFTRTTATPFTFQERKVFDNRINATKVKTSGEIVDSWTDVLVNEELYVDGKYGQITKIIQNNDLVYCLQEQAISLLEISPRVQTVATDGTSIELGRGQVLYNYSYLNTNSGSVNPQAVFKSQSSIYYIDVINKSINRVIGKDVIGLTDKHGLHSYMDTYLNYHTQKFSKQITGGFDMITNDAYFTTNSFTLAFNEQLDAFTSRYSFKPLRYIYCLYGLYTTDLGLKLWKHGSGARGKYYDVVYPSKITLIVAPEPDVDCVFNNGEYKSEVYNISGVAQHGKTLSTLLCWNEHQSSLTVPLTVGANIKRKFWDWNFFIPRDKINPLQRMRGQWLYMTFDFDNTLNEKLILHDMIISYDAVYKQ
jgi:hypothetical protein